MAKKKNVIKEMGLENYGLPEGLLIANFRFRIRYNRCNSKNLNKLHILIRSPLLCIERNNSGTTIGNKYQLLFVKHRAERRTDEQTDESAYYVCQ